MARYKCYLLTYLYIYIYIIVECDGVCDQLYDQVAVAEITLINTGRVGFDYVGVGMDSCFETSPKPGLAVLMPHMVCII